MTQEQLRKSELGNIQPPGFPGLPPGWATEWETFLSADQKLQLFQAIHRNTASPGPRSLLVVHGLGDHGGRYTHLPHFLHTVVDSIYCIDQRGHGRSEGLQGHCDQFSQFTDDLSMVIARIDQANRDRFGKSELSILGHSFGGLVTLRTLQSNGSLPIGAAILTSPLLGIRVRIPLLKRWAGHALSEIWSTIQMGNEIETEYLSHDPAVPLAYEKDRLVHEKVTPRMFTQMLSAMDEAMNEAETFSYPLQMLLSGQEMIVDPEISRRFFARMRSEQKVLKVYDDFYHEIMNEFGKEKVFEEIQQWIRKYSQNK